MARVDETRVELTLTVVTNAGLANRLKEKIGGLPLILTKVSEATGPGDQRKSHVERLDRAIVRGVKGAKEVREAYSGRGPLTVELQVHAGAGRKGEELDNLSVTIKPEEDCEVGGTQGFDGDKSITENTDPSKFTQIVTCECGWTDGVTMPRTLRRCEIECPECGKTIRLEDDEEAKRKLKDHRDRTEIICECGWKGPWGSTEIRGQHHHCPNCKKPVALPYRRMKKDDDGVDKK